MVNLYELSDDVQRLTLLGSPGAWDKLPWLKYENMGIGKKHIPDLLIIVEHFATFREYGRDNPRSWSPMHAWRALAQLQSQEAIPAFIELLTSLDEAESILIQEDLPKAFGVIGSPSIPALVDYLCDETRGIWSRAAAAEGLLKVAQATQPARGDAASGLAKALANFQINPPILNGIIIKHMIALEHAEDAELVEQAYVAGRVDESISGDWEDFQVGVGLIDERLTSPQTAQVSPTAYRDGLSSEEEEAQQIRRQQIWLKKDKQKRKQAKDSRKMNRKRKKK